MIELSCCSIWAEITLENGILGPIVCSEVCRCVCTELQTGLVLIDFISDDAIE